jgi:hypothetical protein
MSNFSIYFSLLLLVCACQTTAKNERRTPASDASYTEYRNEGFSDPEIQQFLAANVKLKDGIEGVAKISGTSPYRGFHYKQHGCLKGTLNVLSGEDYRAGIFGKASPGSYKIWARFSNGIPYNLPDAIPDFRGFAIKVIDAPGKQLLLDRQNQHIQDFVMMNSPTIIFKKPSEPVELITAFASLKNPETEIKSVFDVLEHLQSSELSSTVGALRKNPNLALPIPSLLTQNYWSAGALKIGSDNVRLRVGRCGKFTMPTIPDVLEHDFLGKKLHSDMLDSDKGYTLCMYASPTSDIEGDGDDAYAGLGKETKIATIFFPQQDTEAPGRREYCDSLAFTPWNGVQDHEPLGTMMRYRRFAYEMSQVMRGAALHANISADYDKVR